MPKQNNTTTEQQSTSQCHALMPVKAKTAINLQQHAIWHFQQL